MTIEEIAAKITEKLAASGGIDDSFKFDLGDDGAIVMSGTEATLSDDEADCTIAVSKDDFLSLMAGDLDPMMAFMSGKLKVSGDMSLAMKLQSLFSA